MRKMTQEQNKQYIHLSILHGELVRAKHFSDAEAFETVLKKMKEVIDNADVRN